MVWDSVSCEDKHAINDINRKKKRHIKTLNLQKSSITVIIDNERYLEFKICLANLTIATHLMRNDLIMTFVVCSLREIQMVVLLSMIIN